MNFRGLDIYTGRLAEIETRDGQIESYSDLGSVDNTGYPYLSHGMIDMQVNGYRGIDYSGIDLNQEGIEEMCSYFRKAGTFRHVPTIITNSEERIIRNVRIIAEACASSDLIRESIAGIHIEGPFISSEDGPRGAHDKKYVRIPDVDEFNRWQEAAAGLIKIVTIAPELDENFELCNYLKSKSITVSAGHCLATDLSAVEQVTHLYNAMGEFSHRNPSTVISALTNNNITVELIADLRHVQKDVIAMTFKLKPHNKIRLISDALPITHSQLTEMEFCSKKIFLKDGLAVDKNGTLAGSTMFVSDMIKLLVENNLIKFESAVAMAECQNTEKYIYWDENYNIVNY